MKRYNQRMGYVTNMTVTCSNEMMPLHHTSGRVEYINTRQDVDIDMSLRVPSNHLILDYLYNIMEPLTKPAIYEEYRCLFCGSANKIIDTHCTQCGAPRSFILG